MTPAQASTPSRPTQPAAGQQRRRLAIHGIVQGVGFRPFVQRVALHHSISGWIANDSCGVTLEIQGTGEQLNHFVETLQQCAPPACRIDHCDSVVIDVEDNTPDTPSPFSIRPSIEQTRTALSIPLDTAPCPACLEEFHNTDSRRYHDPFISCPDCGPRWSILRRLPFDRHHTSFADFPACAACDAEYHSLTDRRYHHQTISCPDCGPSLTLQDASGQTLAGANEALTAAVEALQRGQIVAIKSTGGFQLLVDALNGQAIERLRQRKQRPAKPLAVMFASLHQLQHYCAADAEELRAVQSPARPIVLLPQRDQLPSAIAPGLSSVGAMLPPSPLHQALFTLWSNPLVATSGNTSGEPLCADNDDALQRLAMIADVFLLHDLTITHPLDDSVVRVIANTVTPLRCARGFAPQQLTLENLNSPGLLAVGGHGKNSIAITNGAGILASPYIGDLDSSFALQRFENTIQQLQRFTDRTECAITCDSHPDYASTQWAIQHDPDAQPVQHHIAHFFSVMAEQQYRGPALGVCWDGSGRGDDDSSWGGEFFFWDGNGEVKRIAHLRPFPLPGGDAAVREPRRQALGVLHAIGVEAPPRLRATFTDNEWHNLQRMLHNQLNAPLSSSAGRIIDVMAMLLSGVAINRYEADAAMQLEALAAAAVESATTLPFTIDQQAQVKVINWQPMIEQLLHPPDDTEARAVLAASCMHTLAAMIAAIAADYPDVPVFLSGGVFQNRLLVENTLGRLQQVGRRVYTHRRVPPNDSGLAVGQLYYRLCMQYAT